MKIYPIYKRETPREEDKLTPEEQKKIDRLLSMRREQYDFHYGKNNTLPSITSNVAVIY